MKFFLSIFQKERWKGEGLTSRTFQLNNEKFLNMNISKNIFQLNLGVFL